MGVLDGHIALVAGASSGMGKETALLFAREGARVVVAARRTQRLEEVVAAIRANGGEAMAVTADVSQRPQVDAAVQATLDAFGRIDVLVNSAGLNARNRALGVVTPEDWQRVIDVNLTGAFHLTQAVLPAMRSQHNGLIIHICSDSGLTVDATSGAAYHASKHGMVGLAHAAMIEERKNGLRITLIHPGLVDADILKNRPVPTPREILDRAMKPEDIAAACLFVASLPPRAYVPDLVMLPNQLYCTGETPV